VKRWIVVALLVGAGLAFVVLREYAAPPPAQEEIDDASKQALREILRREEE
jgi:hypothetical protein